MPSFDEALQVAVAYYIPEAEFARKAKPAAGQKSMFDEDSVERETSAHDGKKPGEFAPKTKASRRFDSAGDVVKKGGPFSDYTDPIRDAFVKEEIDEDHPAWASLAMNQVKLEDFKHAKEVFGQHVRPRSRHGQFGKVTDISADARVATVAHADGTESKWSPEQLHHLGAEITSRSQSSGVLSLDRHAEYIGPLLAKEAVSNGENIGVTMKRHGIASTNSVIRKAVADSVEKLRESEERKESQSPSPARSAAMEKQRKRQDAEGDESHAPVSEKPSVEEQIAASPGLIAVVGRKYGYRDADLDDFIADVQVRALKNQDQFDSGKASFSTWLYAVAKNVAHDKHKKSSRRSARVKMTSIDGTNPDGSGLAQDLKDNHREAVKLSETQNGHIHKAILSLPPSQRDAFMAVHLNGQSAGEYASERGITPSAVSGALKSAKETLRKRLLATNEFSRIKPAKEQGGFAFDESSSKSTGYADKPVARVKSQKSFGWDESKVVREKTAHDNKRPGEFATKGESDAPAPESHAEEPQPKQTEPGIPITMENYGRKDRWYALATLPDGTDVTRSHESADEARKLAEDMIREKGHEPAGDVSPPVEPKADAPATVTDVTPAGDDSPAPPAKSPVATETPIKAPAGDQSGYEGASDKGEAESLPQDEQNATASRLADFGEKLAGARKDQEWTGTGVSSKKKSDQPAWRKGYSVNVTKDGKYAVIHDGSGGGRQRQIATFDTPEEAERMIPMAEVARAHSVKNYGTDDAPNYGIYRNITHRKQPVLKDGFASKDEAMRYMAFNAKSLIETKTALTDSIHPRLEEIVREGKTHRLGGKDADVSDFQKFGFRGVTFGNWNNSPERQHILNHAYDSLTDLADILGVPPKSLSLDGDLGLGFGSHGQGLSGARAHYNRQGAVINLTKMHGAGSLAHEWMHALDHWMGRLNGKASSEWAASEDGAARVKAGAIPEDDYASSGLLRHTAKTEFRKEVAEAMTQVMAAIKTRPMKYKEDASSHEKYHTSNLETIQKKLTEFRRQMAIDHTQSTGYQHYKGKRGLPASPEVLKQVDELSAKILAGDAGEAVRHGQSSGDTPANSRSLSWGHSMAANVAKLSDLHKALRGNKGYSATDRRLSGIIAEIESAHLSHAKSKARLAEASEQKEKIKSVRSEFTSEAERMDRGTKGEYWARDHELAARAFESYVYDKIKSNKGRDDFLSYEKHNDLPEYKRLNVKPFPETEERAAINAAFDNLFQALSSHEMSGGREATQRPATRILPKDDGTWRGHWGSKGAKDETLDSMATTIGNRSGVLHVNKKGTSATFYTVNANWPMERLHDHISKKPGKAFRVTNDAESTASFSRDLATACVGLFGFWPVIRSVSQTQRNH